ncbi:MAG: pirin family protein [Chloroflexi bacterium]|nr:pirin family protein [Chloroflexota bacterium]
MTTTSASRSVSRVVQTVQTYEGAGFPVRRPFPTQTQMDFDPFLLLDHLGPVDYPPGEAKGAPDHPHRGFETVTYVLEGRMEHKDSAGNAGKLGPGDVQWMTAGAGVVHSEMPEEAFLNKGGRLQGFQLWVNLPRKEKMIAPRYQDTPSAKIPVATSEDGAVRVKVIAGESLGKRAVIETRTPIAYLHFTLQPGATFFQPTMKDHNSFAYVISGRGKFGFNAREAKEGQAVFFAGDGESVSLENVDAKLPLDVLVISGVPLREPVVRYGPFVMNTREEIIKAFDDFQSGRMGYIAH